jgi:hypothetical protein
MQEISLVSFSGVFALRDGVSEEEFLPRLHAFFRHFIDMGFATGYRVMRTRRFWQNATSLHVSR